MQPLVAAFTLAVAACAVAAQDACRTFDGIAAIQVEVVKFPSIVEVSPEPNTSRWEANHPGQGPFDHTQEAKRVGALPNPVNHHAHKVHPKIPPGEIIHTRGHFNSVFAIMIFATLAVLSVAGYCVTLLYSHDEQPPLPSAPLSPRAARQEQESEDRLKAAVAKALAIKKEKEGSRKSTTSTTDDAELPDSNKAHRRPRMTDEDDEDEIAWERRRSEQQADRSARKASLVHENFWKDRRATWSSTMKAWGLERWSPEEGEETMSAFAFVVNVVADLCPSGFLSLSYGMDGTGYIWTIVIMIIFYCLCVYTMWCCGRTCEISGERDFASQWALVIGPGGAWIPLLVIVIVAFGALLCYACYFGDLLEEVMPALGLHLPRYACLICFSLFPALPLCLLKNLSALAYTSSAAVVALIYTAAVMAIRLHDGSYAPGGMFYGGLRADLVPNPPEGHYLFNIGGRTLLFVNILAMAFHCHCNACKYYRELQNTTPRHFRNCTIVAMGVALVLYATIAMVGFKTFGRAANGTILKNYSLEDMPVNIARILISISLVASYAIMFSALREAFIGLLKHIFQGAVASSFDLVWRQDVLSAILVGGVTMCGVLSKDSGLVDGFVGAFCGNAIIYIIPCLLYTATVRSFLDKKRNRRSMAFSTFLVCLGVLLAIAGCICLVVFEVEAEPERPVQHHWKKPHSLTAADLENAMRRWHSYYHLSFGKRPPGRHIWSLR